uniref:Uncharacterized protein n=1 Tax=Timema douglasi TaxID=61478 RepID=A0A7R8Z7U8_TIMDO|nr:unnamed protein product [Timema douglasi]
MASLVLTDSSQLTSDSQHLGSSKMKVKLSVDDKMEQLDSNQNVECREETDSCACAERLLDAKVTNNLGLQAHSSADKFVSARDRTGDLWISSQEPLDHRP